MAAVTRVPASGENAFSFGEMFPTWMSFIVFISYMALFINQGILITATKSSNKTYGYNTTTVVLLTEVVKLIAAIVLHLRNESVTSLVREVFRNLRVFGLYFVPAFLYCMYNNLSFVNLAVFDPTTYFLLLQLRVVVTGVIFQMLFKKKLSRKQWMSLLFLTLGCVIKQLSMVSAASRKTGANEIVAAQEKMVDVFSELVNINILLILLQVFASCFAGVYNEYLLKDTGANIPLMLQNVFMYADSILCNLTVLLFKNELGGAFTPTALSSVIRFSVMAIIANNAAIGIVTSLFLKSLNSILKSFASALELMFTAVLCWLIFGIPIDLFTFIAIAIVSYATYLYSQHPVVNRGKVEEKAVTKDHTPDADGHDWARPEFASSRSTNGYVRLVESV